MHRRPTAGAAPAEISPPLYGLWEIRYSYRMDRCGWGLRRDEDLDTAATAEADIRGRNANGGDGARLGAAGFDRFGLGSAEAAHPSPLTPELPPAPLGIRVLRRVAIAPG